MKLTLKQKKFCDYYMSSGNATESAIKAGYSKKTAKQIGMENLTKPYLQEYIKEHSEKEEEHRMLDAKNRQKLLADIFEGRVMEEEAIISDSGDSFVIKKPMKWDTRLKAGEQLNRMQGEYLERLEVSGKLNTEIITNIENQIKEKGIR